MPVPPVTLPAKENEMNTENDTEATEVQKTAPAAAAPAAPKAVKLSSLTSDVEKEDGGDWVDIPQLAPARLRVRSSEYRPYKVALQAHARAHARRYKGNETPESMQADYEARGLLLAKYILLGWEGFDVPYSPEAALEMMPDRKWRPLREWVQYAAGEAGAAVAEFVEDAAKN